MWQCLSNGVLSLATEQNPSSRFCLMQVSHKELNGLEHTSLLLAPPQPKVGQLAGQPMGRAAPPTMPTRSCPCSSHSQRASRCCLACCGACYSR